MSVHRAILLGACFWGLAAAAVLLWRGGAARAAGTGPAAPAPAGAPAPAAHAGTEKGEPIHPGWKAEPQAEAAAAEPAARYPDGTSARLLNGVTQPMVVTWPDRIPFTPIVGTYRDGPPHYWEWHVHADGTQSTVAMFRLRPDTEPVPTSFVRHPRPIGPMRATGDGRFVPVR